MQLGPSRMRDAARTATLLMHVELAQQCALARFWHAPSSGAAMPLIIHTVRQVGLSRDYE